MAGLRSLRGLTRHSGCLYCCYAVVPFHFAASVHHRLVFTLQCGRGFSLCGLFTFLTGFLLGVGRSIHTSLFLLGWIFLVRIVNILIVRGVLSVILLAFLVRLVLLILRLLFFVLRWIFGAVLLLILLLLFLWLILLLIILRGGLLRLNLLSPILGTRWCWSATLRHLALWVVAAGRVIKRRKLPLICGSPSNGDFRELENLESMITNNRMMNDLPHAFKDRKPVRAPS